MRIAERTPVRVAVHQHEQRGPFGKEDVGYVVLHREARFTAFVGAGVTGLQPLGRGGETVFSYPVVLIERCSI